MMARAPFFVFGSVITMCAQGGERGSDGRFGDKEAECIASSDNALHI